MYSLDPQTTRQFVEKTWDDSILPTLQEYITIPNKSPAYDKDWQSNGYMEQAVKLLAAWCQDQHLAQMKLETIRMPGRTPLIFIEIPGQLDSTVLLYGHYDKQPEMEGWRADLGPWKAVIEGDKLYGRGGADDGYAIFASLTAIKALQLQKIPHPRCVLIIEGCEESGSLDLPYYLEQLNDRIGEPKLVVCLDSGCANYEQLWCTTSLRGLVSGTLRVAVMSQGVHSGVASGIVPSCFRIIRQLLSRIEDVHTGEILLDAVKQNIDPETVNQAQALAAVAGASIRGLCPLLPGVTPVSDNLTELSLNQSWRSALEVTGIEGLPSLEDAGSTMRPQEAIKLSLRLPPGIDPQAAGLAVKKTLEQDPPYGAKVSFKLEQRAPGWEAPKMADWLKTAANNASQRYFNKPALRLGEGGTIPFMGMLTDKFPQAQFVITGVLGPGSNAHGPNEFLHIPMAKNLTCCVADLLISAQ